MSLHDRIAVRAYFLAQAGQGESDKDRWMAAERTELWLDGEASLLATNCAVAWNTAARGMSDAATAAAKRSIAAFKAAATRKANREAKL